MFKKIMAALTAALLIASLLALQVSAGAMNPADGCKTEVTVKKAAPGAVVHDGVISEGEYEEIEVSRDSDTTDLLLSWNGSGNMLLLACDFLKDVHFFISWDDENVNFAARATLLEDPYCNGTMEGTDQRDYIGDEFFMFQFGFMAKIENPDDWEHEFLYRTFGKNTETGEYLVGQYWADGHTGSLTMTQGKDFEIGIDGRTVTYEVSYPLASVLAADQLSGGAPVDGAKFCFTLSMTGGSMGTGWDAGATYAVSLGDGGYMTSMRSIGNYSGAWATLSGETLVDEPVGPGPDNPNPDDPTPDNPTPDNPNPGDQTPGDREPENNNPSNNAPEGSGNGGDKTPGKTAPKTGDPMIVIAAVAALSAAGAFITKKRR